MESQYKKCQNEIKSTLMKSALANIIMASAILETPVIEHGQAPSKYRSGKQMTGKWWRHRKKRMRIQKESRKRNRA